MIYSLKPLSLLFKVGTKMCFCSIFKASFKNKMQYGFMDAYVYSIDKMKAIWFLWTRASVPCLIFSDFSLSQPEKFVSSETVLTQIETNYIANFLSTFLISCFLLYISHQLFRHVKLSLILRKFLSGLFLLCTYWVLASTCLKSKHVVILFDYFILLWGGGYPATRVVKHQVCMWYEWWLHALECNTMRAVAELTAFRVTKYCPRCPFQILCSKCIKCFCCL